MHRRHFILAIAFACALSAAACGGPNQSRQAERPPLGLEEIKRNINGHVVETPSSDGKSKPIEWFFDPSEPKEIEIAEQKFDGDSATFLVNIRTRTAPRSRNPRSLSGQLRLHYRLESGIVLRQWRVEDIDNVSFTYTNEAPPSPSNDHKGEGDAGNANAGSSANANAKPDSNSGDARRPPAPPQLRP